MLNLYNIMEGNVLYKDFIIEMVIREYKMITTFVRSSFVNFLSPSLNDLFFNPLLLCTTYMTRLVKIFTLILEGIVKKISYERRDYEFVDENILSLAMSRKTKKT